MEHATRFRDVGFAGIYQRCALRDVSMEMENGRGSRPRASDTGIIRNTPACFDHVQQVTSFHQRLLLLARGRTDQQCCICVVQPALCGGAEGRLTAAVMHGTMATLTLGTANDSHTPSSPC